MKTANSSGVPVVATAVGGTPEVVADGETEWTGVRNHQAAANMRAMKLDDPVFFYRSMVEPAIVGVMRISAEAYPDPKDAAAEIKGRIAFGKGVQVTE